MLLFLCRCDETCLIEHRVTKMKKGEKLSFRVFAVNVIGTSPPSNIVGLIECKDDIGNIVDCGDCLRQVVLLRIFTFSISYRECHNGFLFC